MNLFDLLLKSGFAPHDVLIALFCPILGAIGGFSHAFLVDHDWSKMPLLEFTDHTRKEEKRLRPSSRSTNLRGIWLIGRLLLGLILGLGVALFFLGSIQNTVAAISKIFLLSLIAGFGAPKTLGYIDQNLVKKIQLALEK